MSEPPAPHPGSAAEGTIRFAYSLEAPQDGVTDAATVHALRGWREVLRRLDLLGQAADRYGGFGFGNMSARDPAAPDQFVITASQTSGAAEFSERSLVRIAHSNVERFWVDAIGHRPPSSESLSHAMIYQADPSIGWIFHVHSPDIWQRSSTLGLPTTAEAVAYGTPAMARAVSQLLADHPVRPLSFATLGHEDGIFACAATPGDAGAELAELLARALV